jgi:beta-galactosidase
MKNLTSLLVIGVSLTLACVGLDDGTSVDQTPAVVSALYSVTATASSVNGTNTAAKAVDGNTSTRWESMQGHDPEWIYVDLGSMQPIGEVKLIWENAYAKAYQLQWSNDAMAWNTFENITNKTTNAADDYTGLSLNARYVRMYGTTRATQYGYSIYEFQVSASTSTGTGGTGGTGGAAGSSGSGGSAGSSGSGGSAGSGGTGGTGGAAGSGGASGSLGRVDSLISSSWRFHQGDVSGAQATGFDDSSWTLLSVPHTWNATDGQDGGSNYYRGIGWYRRHITVPADSTGRHVYLSFDGSNIVSDVYVNGTLAGEHRGGFARFRYDVTSLVTAGDNVVAVKVSNASFNDVPPLTADFTFFGGMYRDVHMTVFDPVHIDQRDFGASGIYLTPTSVTSTSATLGARVRVTNESAATKTADVSVAIKDASGATVTTLSKTGTSIGAGATVDVTVSTTISNPHLWKGRVDPYVYSAVVNVSSGGVVTDTDTAKFGFRAYQVSTTTGFSLNGSAYDLHGVNRHQDRLNKGWAISTGDQDQDMNLMTEMGVTAIRTAHYQNSQYFYDICDSNGLVAWVEIPVVGTSTNGGIPATTAPEWSSFNTNAQQQLKELIRQNYNHPSIMFWSLSNEVTATTQANTLLTTLNSLAHTEDSTRLTTLASNISGVNATTGVVSNPNNAYNYIFSHTDLAGFNRYDGWYSGAIGDFTTWLDFFHTAYPNVKTGVSEYGAGMGETIHSDTPVSQDHSEEYGITFHDSYWGSIQSRGWLWGKFIWNMFDFAVDSRNEGETPGRNDKGLVTYDRTIKKDAFYYYKANWSTIPTLYIASRRFTAARAASITVKVFSNMDSAVTLTVHGTSLGSKTCSATHVCTWTGVALQTGSNAVSVSGTKGGTGYTDSVSWTH